MIHGRDALLPALMARWFLSDGLILRTLDSKFTSGEGQGPDKLEKKENTKKTHCTAGSVCEPGGNPSKAAAEPRASEPPALWSSARRPRTFWQDETSRPTTHTIDTSYLLSV